MKEEPAFRSLSRRILLERVIKGLGGTLALGHVVSRVFVRCHFGPPPAELLSDPNWRLSVGAVFWETALHGRGSMPARENALSRQDILPTFRRG